MKFINKLQLCGLLSFAPDTAPFELRDLNVLIGPNGSGKSNVIEAIELLRATPTDFAAAIRDGGGAAEWLWKGEEGGAAKIEIETGDRNSGVETPTTRALRYRLEFENNNTRVEVVDEAIEETKPQHGHERPYFYYRFDRGNPVINVRDWSQGEEGSKSSQRERKLQRQDMRPEQSVLAQIKSPDIYPEITWLGKQYEQIQIARDWTWGRYTAPRQAQPADLPEDRPLPDFRNLALLLNKIENEAVSSEFNDMLKRFFPRYERMTTRVSAGTIQFNLHEVGFAAPIPATRLSDGTIRFVALLSTLLNPNPPSIICIDEPELGLHPDAMTLVAELLIEASERAQLIVATHSDALVSALTSNPESVIACERLGAGTTLRRLAPMELEHLLEDFSLGDLWRMGELGANP